MTLAQLISQLRGQMATKLEQRNKLAKDLAELRSAETVDEAKVTEIRGQKDALDAEVDALELRAKELEAEQSKDDEAIRKAREITPTEVRTPAYDQVARVGQEARTYSPDTDKRGKSFLQDVTRQFLFNDHSAGERLARHMQEEQVERGQYLERATNTGAFTGLVVPQYLTDLYAPATAALRPFADICNTHELPASGMTVNISRITTASSVALQSAENAAVAELDMDDTLLTIPVQTASGQQTISRQAIDRGTGIEDVTLSDLFRRYATALDSTLLNQASTGLSAVSQVTAFTTASPTAALLYPKLLGAGAGIEAALLGQANPDYAIMHSRRWAWLQSQVGPNWPAFAQPNMDPQSMGVNKGVGYNKGVRGVLPNGLLAIVDNNIVTNTGVGTNEDEIYVVPSDECHLWEDPQAPVFIRAEQTKAASLGVLLVVYGYFAYTYARYTNGTAKVGGTGLVVPVF